MQSNKNKKRKLNKEEFNNLWRELPEFFKKRRIKKAYSVAKPVIKKQISLLNEYKESEEKEKSSGHLYLFNTVKNFYDNIELVFLMGKNRLMRNFALYPARTCMESLMRFMYFCKQDKNKRDEITDKEMLRIYARLYKREKKEGIINQDCIKAYNDIIEMSALSNVPDIDSVKEDKEFDPFPKMPELCNSSERKDPQCDYFIYKCLCEDIHGKLIAIVIRSQSKKYQNFIRATMLLINLWREMLILVDKEFLDSKEKKSIKACIEDINEIVMGPKSFFEKIFTKRIK